MGFKGVCLRSALTFEHGCLELLEKYLASFQPIARFFFIRGTEPSALFISEDSGETWERREGMEKLPSANRWSFPPRPDCHHVSGYHAPD